MANVGKDEKEAMKVLIDQLVGQYNPGERWHAITLTLEALYVDESINDFLSMPDDAINQV